MSVGSIAIVMQKSHTFHVDAAVREETAQKAAVTKFHQNFSLSLRPSVCLSAGFTAFTSSSAHISSSSLSLPLHHIVCTVCLWIISLSTLFFMSLKFSRIPYWTTKCKDIEFLSNKYTFFHLNTYTVKLCKSMCGIYGRTFCTNDLLKVNDLYCQ